MSHARSFLAGCALVLLPVSTLAQSQLPDVAGWVELDNRVCDRLEISVRSQLSNAGFQQVELYQLTDVLIAYALYGDYRHEITVGVLSEDSARWYEATDLDAEAADTRLRYASLLHGGPDLDSITDCWRDNLRGAEDALKRGADQVGKSLGDLLKQLPNTLP